MIYCGFVGSRSGGPSYRGGRYVGYWLLGGNASPVLFELGFEYGDRVLAVNGADIDSPNKEAWIYDALAHKADVRVLIARADEPLMLHFRIRK